jgi:hypothetical protein
LLIRIPAEGNTEIIVGIGADYPEPPVAALKLYEMYPEPPQYFPIPGVEKPQEPKITVCEKCGGTGEAECPHCGQDLECEDCDGKGKSIEKIEERRIRIGGIDFSDRYLWLIKENCPGAEIGPVECTKPARIKFNGGDGFLMSIRS